MVAYVPAVLADIDRLEAPALHLPPDLSYDEWSALAERLGKLVKWSNWLLGDWLRYGAARFGEMASQAEALTGLDYQTLANARWVAGAVPPERRVAHLSWSHHLEVASLPAEAQAELLALAAPDVAAGETEPRLSVRDLRDEARLRKTSAGLTPTQAYVARVASELEAAVRRLTTAAAPEMVLHEVETIAHDAISVLREGTSQQP